MSGDELLGVSTNEEGILYPKPIRDGSETCEADKQHLPDIEDGMSLIKVDIATFN